MFDDIRGDRRINTYVSYVIAFCMIGITLITILIPQLRALYSADDGSINILIRLTIPFQHGFDTVSAIIHLIINLILLWFFGTFLEKVIGSFRFLVITLVSYFFYILVHRLLMLMGHGFTPILLTYAGTMIIVMLEGRFVKTRSAFEDYFKVLRGLQIVVWFLFPVIVSVVPLYFDSKTSMVQNVVYGNISHVVGGILGVLLGVYFKSHIREKLMQHTRKRYIKHDRLDQMAVYLSLGFPLYLIMIFFVHPT